MMVANDRVEEYKAAGHKLAADLGTRPVKVEKPKQEEPVVAKKTVIRKKK